MPRLCCIREDGGEEKRTRILAYDEAKKTDDSVCMATPLSTATTPTLHAYAPDGATTHFGVQRGRDEMYKRVYPVSAFLSVFSR
jgi:hypothetical protein